MYILVFPQANYTDPQTKLRFSSSEEFSYIRLLPTDVVTGYLTLRKATCIVPWETFSTQTHHCGQSGTAWRLWAHISHRETTKVCILLSGLKKRDMKIYTYHNNKGNYTSCAFTDGDTDHVLMCLENSPLQFQFWYISLYILTIMFIYKWHLYWCKQCDVVVLH